jgi:prevent-host-death family protein
VVVMILRTSTFIPDVRPVSDLRQNMAGIMESIDTENRPVILTKHGRGKYILLSIEDYNRITALNQLHEAINEGIADIESGRVSDFREYATQLREELIDGRL